VGPDPVSTRRRPLLGLLALGLVGLATELLFLEHYEDGWMLIPLGAIGAAAAALATMVVVAAPWTVRAFQGVMTLLILTGALGVVLHYRGSLEFQVDMDPTLSRGQLFWKVMHMKAPPTLAPGALAQLGLLGLISVYRHPALHRDSPVISTGAKS
jgi:hypothetical protein